MARAIKLTNNPADRKDQRLRTQKLIDETKNMNKLQETPPKILTGVARYVWKQIVPALNEQGWLKQTDKQVVEQLCVQIAIYHEAYEHIFLGVKGKDGKRKEAEGISTAIYTAVQNSAGEILEHRFTGYKANPNVKTLDNAATKIKTLSDALGMTPQSRAQLLSISDDSENASIEDLRKAFG